MSTKMLYTVAYGAHWERYGQRFESMCRALEVRPNRIAIISDRPINTKHENIVITPSSKISHVVGEFRQKAIDVCDCDWLVQFDIDDIMYSNYLNYINEDCDWHVFSMRNNEMYMNEIQSMWDKFFDQELGHMGGFMNSAIRTTMLRKVGGYKLNYGWEDMILVIDMKYQNGRLAYDSPTDFRGERILNNPGSITKNTIDASVKSEETKQYKANLKKLYYERERK